MLSYRHAFHAGNHADVLKHCVLRLVLEYMLQKDKPFSYIDTHAGAGLYSLEEGYAAQNAEYAQGIDKLINATDLPPALMDYVLQIQSYDNGGARLYPGSPLIAQDLLRADDRMRLFELHPSDLELLLENFRGQGKQVKIEKLNGFAGIKACLPPPSRRAAVLIDPPYEDKQDYQYVVDCVRDSLNRFATGTYMVWYPLMQRPEPLDMVEQLKVLNTDNWLNVTLAIEAPSNDGYGMYGSGLYIVNPPWTLPDTLKTILPVMIQLLGLDTSAHYTLDYQIT
jgi:23S rRNA (adenine2030-N6)-methyltransferase